MSALFISLLTLVLILISAFIVLIVLMQRTSQSGGMGAALGGGAAESAFGSDTTNVLTKSTIYGIIAFFVVALGLYLIYQANADDAPLAQIKHLLFRQMLRKSMKRWQLLKANRLRVLQFLKLMLEPQSR